MKMLHHKFVDFMPDTLEENTLYVSIEYCTAIHLCVCGCGNKVITPISPTSWQLTYDGKTISLSPSIGNWNFDCQSHYWITNNKIEHARKWNKKEISDGRVRDEKVKSDYYKELSPVQEEQLISASNRGLVKRILNYLGL